MLESLEVWKFLLDDIILSFTGGYLDLKLLSPLFLCLRISSFLHTECFSFSNIFLHIWLRLIMEYNSTPNISGARVPGVRAAKENIYFCALLD